MKNSSKVGIAAAFALSSLFSGCGPMNTLNKGLTGMGRVMDEIEQGKPTVEELQGPVDRSASCSIGEFLPANGAKFSTKTSKIFGTWMARNLKESQFFASVATGDAQARYEVCGEVLMYYNGWGVYEDGMESVIKLKDRTTGKIVFTCHVKRRGLAIEYTVSDVFVNALRQSCEKLVASGK